jgi:hypothetical protein
LDIVVSRLRVTEECLSRTIVAASVAPRRKAIEGPFGAFFASRDAFTTYRIRRVVRLAFGWRRIAIA